MPIHRLPGLTPLNGNKLLVVLSSLTCHLITNLLTGPTLAPQEESLKLSLAARDVFLEDARAEYMAQNRRIARAEDERGMTAYTQGLVRAGDWGAIFCWASECVASPFL
jgi:hypothetical protein